MGHRFQNWRPRTDSQPQSLEGLQKSLLDLRSFAPVDQLNYGDHGLEGVYQALKSALNQNKRIALYADYDVDGTMSCVSWIWFFKAIGYQNYCHYIPDRFKEGYGLNLKAVQFLIEQQKADVIITMDTGITANEEAAYCRQRGVQFICTDHHKIQVSKMPDCLILNPKLHPQESYQELCGCGITFVLLRKLGRDYMVGAETWNDLLALTGMATICDVVPLNPVNHRLAQMGVQALGRSQRPVIRSLLEACRKGAGVNEVDVGFRLGPRINAVGRLQHAHVVIEAFVDEHPDELVAMMDRCNEERRQIQAEIIAQAQREAETCADDAILFLGGAWHQGVVGIAASKIAEQNWKPTWLFDRGEEFCKGSARSIPGFDVTEAMASCGDLFLKFGGHRAAGGYLFERKNEDKIRLHLLAYVEENFHDQKQLWQSSIDYDCSLPESLLSLNTVDLISQLRPYGHGFEEPKFVISGELERLQILKCRTTGEAKHSLLHIKGSQLGLKQRVIIFNEVLDSDLQSQDLEVLVQLQENTYLNKRQLSIQGIDWRLLR